MPMRSPMYVLVVLLSASATLTGCSQSEAPDLTSPAGTHPVSLTAEPNAIVPEILPHGGCSTAPGFGLRFVLRLGGPPHIAFQRVRFRFDDRLGRTLVPHAAFGSHPISAAASFPSSGPVPIPTAPTLPSASPIPIPGATPLQGVLSSFGSARQLPVSLTFGCGTHRQGTLFVVVDFEDHGRSRSSEVRLKVG